MAKGGAVVPITLHCFLAVLESVPVLHRRMAIVRALGAMKLANPANERSGAWYQWFYHGVLEQLCRSGSQ
jgi:hypothetical protein